MENLVPAVVRVYDYYNPELFATKNYTFETWEPTPPIAIDPISSTSSPIPIPVVTALPIPLQAENNGSVPRLVSTAEDCKPNQKFDSQKQTCYDDSSTTTSSAQNGTQAGIVTSTIVPK
ncbi:unnamed protein product, partial [Notodromas monacha]